MSQKYDNKYDNNMKGGLWDNKEKKTDKHPVLKGKITIRNEVFYLAAWLNRTAEGKQWFSLAASEPQNKTETPKKEDDFPFS